MSDELNLDAQQQEENRDERPEWLPENFKSPEDLANSYRELQGEFTRTRQQMKEQQEAWEGYLAQQAEAQQQEQWRQQAPSLQDQLYADYESDPLGTTARLIQAAVGQAQQQWSRPDPSLIETQAVIAGKYAEDNLSARYNDWTDYKQQVSQEIEANPDLYPESLFTTPQGIEKALDRAYKAVKLDALSSSSTETIEQQIANQRAMKLQAQTLSGAAGRPEAPDNDEEFFSRLKAAHNQSWSAFRGVA